MVSVDEIFNKWSENGRSEYMEKEHSKTTLPFINSLNFENDFTFLDVGCGNGWVVRKIAKIEQCVSAYGIDTSGHMIKNALSKKSLENETYVHTSIEEWNYNENFDYIFSMESLYYSVPMEPALQKIFNLLKNNGKFFCGTDFYVENKDTMIWANDMKVPMDLRTKQEWKNMFEKIGFSVTMKQITTPNDEKRWRREIGTLFLTGHKL